jgi:hypothetical protein
LNRVYRCRWDFVDTLPVGNEPFAFAGAIAVLLLPARLADIKSEEGGFLIEEQRVVDLFIRKALAAALTGVGATLNIPVSHENQRGNVSRAVLIVTHSTATSL